MTKSIHVSEDAHDKLYRLMGVFYDVDGKRYTRVEQVVDRVLRHAGYVDAFFEYLERKAEQAKVQGVGSE